MAQIELSELAALLKEVDRLRSALERIADQGPELTNDWQHWSDIARDALDEDTP